MRVQKVLKQQPDYKLEHYQAFAKAQMKWPPTYTDYPNVVTGGMFPREAELAMYVMTVFPMPVDMTGPGEEGIVVEYIDLHPPMYRLLESCLEEDSWCMYV